MDWRVNDGDAVVAAETRRANKIESDVADMRHRFVDGPVLPIARCRKYQF
jgi:hypothetical protein